MEVAGFFSIVSLSWMTPLFNKARTTRLTVDDLEDTLTCESLKTSCERLEHLWQDELLSRGKHHASIGLVILRFVLKRCLLGVLCLMVAFTAAFTNASYVTQELLLYVEESDGPLWKGIALAMGFFVAYATATVFINLGYFINVKTGTRLRNAVLAAVFRKLLRLRNLQHKSVGEIVNLCVNDGHRLYEMVLYSPYILVSPCLIIAGLLYCSFLIGKAAVYGMVTFVIFYSIQIFSVRYLATLRKAAIDITDQRVLLVSEIITCIKLIKMYTWEEPFTKAVQQIRDQERRALERVCTLRSLNTALTPLVPMVACVVAFSTHVALGNNLMASEAFTFVAVTASMRSLFSMAQKSVRSLGDCLISLQRIQEVLLMTEVEQFHVEPAVANHVIEIKAVTAIWDESVRGSDNSSQNSRNTNIVLSNVSLDVKKGSLVGICGGIGSGKSTLFATILGHTHILCGDIAIRGSLAFVAQQPVILNATIRDNIIFGENFDAERYDEVLRICCLCEDITNFTDGDITKIGDRGINLSGGQKQRISLARALYANRDIYLLDDPLSAVDVHIGQFIFKHCIQGALAEKTVIFVTHQLQYLSRCNEVVLLDNGTVIEKGFHKELLQSHGPYAHIMRSFSSSISNDVHQSQKVISGTRSSMPGGLSNSTHNPSSQLAFSKAPTSFPNIFNSQPSASHVYDFPDNISTLMSSSSSSSKEGELLDLWMRKSPSASSSSSYALSQEFSTNTAIRLSYGFIAHSADPSPACARQLFLNKSRPRITHNSPTNIITHVVTPSFSQNVEQPIVSVRRSVAREMLLSRVPDSSNPFLMVQQNLQAQSGIKRHIMSMPIMSRRHGRVDIATATSDTDILNMDWDTGDRELSTIEDADVRNGVEDSNDPDAVSARKWESVYQYIRYAGGLPWCILSLLLFVASPGISVFSNWWLSYWIRQGSGRSTCTLGCNITDADSDITANPHLHVYLAVYSSSLILLLLACILNSVIFTKTTLRASSRLHQSVFAEVFRCPLSFFDTTPVGRILNRFSADLDEADVQFPATLESFLWSSSMVLFAVATVSVVFPWYLIAIVLGILVFAILSSRFRPCIRDLKTLDHSSRSPWITHLTSTLYGLATIRAYDKSHMFIDKFEQLLEINSKALTLFMLGNRWLAFRFNSVTNLTILLVTLSIVLLNGRADGAYAGLALSYAAYLLGTFQVAVRMGVEAEARFTSVERINQYIQDLESEESEPPEGHVTVPDDWPSHGRIKLSGVTMRYRSSSPEVLRGITCNIQAGEKIGIVGRTGSGKSSLVASLFRLVELKAGTITIDDVDTAKIPLQVLRSRLAIIPQDPILFVGSIRYNLDPYSKYSDEELWTALEKTYMKDKILALPCQLEALIDENGANFSLGERQLLCIARAILQESKILILDEATAAVDRETDCLIQATIHEAFTDCTILTVAHKLHTVCDCDKILLLENGQIAEFGAPGELLSNPRSLFSQMVCADTP